VWHPSPYVTCSTTLAIAHPIILHSRVEEAMLAIAAGEVDETWTAARLEERVQFADRG